jgi:hypothetical protein
MFKFKARLAILFIWCEPSFADVLIFTNPEVEVLLYLDYDKADVKFEANGIANPTSRAVQPILKQLISHFYRTMNAKTTDIFSYVYAIYQRKFERFAVTETFSWS